MGIDPGSDAFGQCVASLDMSMFEANNVGRPGEPWKTSGCRLPPWEYSTCIPVGFVPLHARSGGAFRCAANDGWRGRRCRDDSEETQGGRRSVSGLPKDSGMRILIIEDEQKLAEILLRSLRGEGFIVDAAPTADEDLSLWRRRITTTW